MPTSVPGGNHDYGFAAAAGDRGSRTGGGGWYAVCGAPVPLRAPAAAAALCHAGVGRRARAPPAAGTAAQHRAPTTSASFRIAQLKNVRVLWSSSDHKAEHEEQKKNLFLSFSFSFSFLFLLCFLCVCGERCVGEAAAWWDGPVVGIGDCVAQWDVLQWTAAGDQQLLPSCHRQHAAAQERKEREKTTTKKDKKIARKQLYTAFSPKFF